MVQTPAWEHYDDCAKQNLSFPAMAACGKQKRTAFCEANHSCAPEGDAVVDYADHLAQSMAVHLLQGHCSGIGARSPAAAMSISKLSRVVDYIDVAMDGELTLDAMAEVADMNPYYFARAFRRQFGESPHRFVSVSYTHLTLPTNREV